jgi:hypothetical protein
VRPRCLFNMAEPLAATGPRRERRRQRHAGRHRGDGRERRNRSCRARRGLVLGLGGHGHRWKSRADVVGLGPGNARPAAPAVQTRTCEPTRNGDDRTKWPRGPGARDALHVMRRRGDGVAGGPPAPEVKAPVAVASPVPRVVRCADQGLTTLPWPLALPLLAV